MIVTGMSVLLLVTAGIGIFGNGKLVKAEEVAQKPSEVTITLHKKVSHLFRKNDRIADWFLRILVKKIFQESILICLT